MKSTFYEHQHCSRWEKVPDLQPKYGLMKRRFRFLVEKGLTSMMVLHHFLSKHIAPAPGPLLASSVVHRPEQHHMLGAR
jgi:hypothetical protein